MSRKQFVYTEHYQQNTVAIWWAANPRQWRNGTIENWKYMYWNTFYKTY